MNDADRRAIEHLAMGVPLRDHYAELAQCTALGQVALLLAQDESAIEAWYDAAPEQTGPVARVLSRAVDRDDVADLIDSRLTSDPTVLDDLRRTQIAWSHDALPDLLDKPSYRASAAYMLALADIQPLADWLDADREPHELVDVACAVAPTGVAELFELLAPWYGPIAEAAPQLAPRFEAALLVVSPELWARGRLHGNWTSGFLNDSRAMADILTASGPSYWSGALARLDGHEEFSSVARMATAGAAAMLHFCESDEIDGELIQAFYQEDFATLAAHPAFAVTIALAEETEWQAPLLESAAHDLLLSAGVESPGIGGLVLSASEPDQEEIAMAIEVSEHSDVDPIALIATMCDVLELRTVREFSALPQAFAHFQSHEHAAVAATASELAGPIELAAQITLAKDESMSGIAAAERITRLGTMEARAALAELFADGPVSRSPLFAMLLHQEFRTLPLEMMEK